MSRIRWGFLTAAVVLGLLAGNAIAAPPPHANAARPPPKKTTTTLAATTTTVAPTTTAGPTTTLGQTTTTTEPPLPTTTTITIGGTYGPQPGVTQPGGSTAVAPGASIASAITAAGAGGTVWLQAGLHRLSAPFTPLSNQTILGEYGAIVDGSVVISGPWTQAGAAWWATAQLPASASTAGVCESGGSDCKPAEDVYRDGQHLTRVMSQGAVTAGTYFGDYTNNRIYVGNDPTGHLIEQAKTAAMIGNSQSINGGVTIRNLQIRKFANPAQNGALVVNNSSGTGWVIDHNELYLNHADAVRVFQHNATVRANILRDNGNLGLGAYDCDFLVVESNRVQNNNNNGYETSWEAGGMKLVQVDDTTIRSNQVTDNIGTGIWIDIDSRRVLIEDNDANNNTSAGIHYEISYDGTIRGNRVNGNDDEGISWNASARGAVENNILAGNGWGLVFYADPNRLTTDPQLYPGDPRDLYDVTVSNNSVDHPTPANYAAGIDLLSGAPTSHLAEVTFTANSYRLPYRSDDAFFYDTANTFSQWQANGKDTGGVLAGPVALNTAEGGTDQAAVSLANSGGTSGLALNATVPAGGTLVFDAARAAKGTKSYKLATGGTAGSVRLTWTTGVGTLSGTVWLRLYLYWTANPAAPVRLINLLQGGATQASGLTLTTAGLLQ